MADALKCDFCKTLYEIEDIGACVKEFDCWKNNPWPVKDYWLAHITLVSNGHDPYRCKHDICPNCSKKLADFFKTLKK